MIPDRTDNRMLCRLSGLQLTGERAVLERREEGVELLPNWRVGSFCSSIPAMRSANFPVASRAVEAESVIPALLR